ncbi:MAG: flavodoxin family protein [Eubacteriales bacterium]|nr:flavodoxin family protein [Eubacteriales bacterium]
MNIHVVYSSLTGNTEKVAKAIYAGYKGGEKLISKIKEKPDISAADIVAVGYWVDKGGPNTEAMKFLESIKGKKVFVFATLAYFADSEHGFDSVNKGCEIAKEAGNEVIGHFVCSGPLDPAMIERFKKMAAEGSTDHHAYTAEKGVRYEMTKAHPTKTELALASERFNERVEMQRRIAELKK